MNKRLVSIFLVGVICSVVAYSQQAYAHNFGGDQSASFLAKVENIKAEVSALEMDLSDSKSVEWHADKLGEYWNGNDTREMGERNQLLAREIPDTIDAITSAAKELNPDASLVKQKIDILNGYLDEGVTVRIDRDKITNSTVQALVMPFILSEVLEDYAQAIGTEMDLNDMENMNKSQNENMSGMNAGSSVPIVNIAAYHSAQMLAQAAKNYYDNNVINLAPANAFTQASKAGSALDVLIQAINSKDSGDGVMIAVHGNFHPNLITAFNLQTIPEFPMPVLLAVISIMVVIAMTRLGPKLR